MGLSAAAHPAGASSVSGDRSRVARLEDAIASEGAKAQQIVARANQAEQEVTATQARLAILGTDLAGEHAVVARLRVQVRQVAIEAYVADGDGAAFAALSAPSGEWDVAAVYASVATSRFESVITNYALATHRITMDRRLLRLEHLAAISQLAQLRIEQRAAQAAVARDLALLGGVRGNLRALLAAAAARQAAAEHAEEQAMARKAAAARAAGAASATTTTRTATLPGTPAARAHVLARAVAVPAASPPPAAPVSPSGAYANPLRAISGLVPERVDQGVDYSGFGPIYAIGDGVVLSTVNSGWPGGTYIAYRLTDGPAAGLTVYAAEDINPQVQVGEAVTPDTVLGTMYGGPDGIETGWANSGLGDTMAAVAGQFSGSNSTAFGANFSQLLQSLGAPGGFLQNSPPTGFLPLGWPTW